MNYFKLGDRVQLKTKTSFNIAFDFSKESGVVVGYGTLGSGVPCLILNMDVKDEDGKFQTHMLASMDNVEPLS